MTLSMNIMFDIDFVCWTSGLQVWLVGIAIFCIAFNYICKEPWQRLPPGPVALPIVGSMLSLGKDIREPLRKMAAKYGNIFTIYMGMKRVVILDGYEIIQDAFVKHAHAFSGRPNIFFLRDINEGYGIVDADGPFWREQRRHTLHILRDFGLGRSVLEDRILEEINYCIEELRKHTGVPFYTQPIIQKSVANVIVSVTRGRRYDYDDPLFIEHMTVMNRCFDVLGTVGALTLFPFLRYLPGDLFHMKQLKRDIQFARADNLRVVHEHKAAFKEGQVPSDFIDAYLVKMAAEKDKPDSTFSDRQLVGVVGDLFGAGTETSSTTLSWSIIYMTLNQDAQARVQAEIDDVIDNGNTPRMKDRCHMPWTDACINEIQRLGDITPLGVPHCTTEDIEFRGYFIPKDTMILANMYSTHKEDKFWSNPDEFQPERFLTADGKIRKRDEFIPFSIGKRLCLGEGLARMELFLYFVSLMKHFRFKLAPGHPPPDTWGRLMITNIPNKFHIVMEPR